MPYIGSQLVGGGTIQSELFSGNASDTDFTLSYPHSSESALLVHVDGVKQNTTTYALVAGQIQFSNPPASGTNNIEVTYLNGPVVQYYITDGSIDTTQIANNAITSDKIAPDTVVAADVAANAITTVELADNSVNSNNINNGAVTNEKVSFTYTNDAFTANGTGNTFTVTTGHTANSVLVSYNGLLMIPITDYDVSGTTLTLTFTPTANSDIAVRYLPV